MEGSSYCYVVTHFKPGGPIVVKKHRMHIVSRFVKRLVHSCEFIFLVVFGSAWECRDS